ncbi:MAG: hypothetical protein JWP89_3084 [Schlesneria sp.]|nr:hypothetical protein [Schlesneria sp.]
MCIARRSQCFDRGLKVQGNLFPAGSFVGDGVEAQRLADADGDGTPQGPFGFGAEGFEAAVEVAGDDWDIGSGEHHSQAGFEGQHLSRATALAFGKQDVAAGLVDQSAFQGFEGMWSALLAPHGECVQHQGCEGADGWVGEEDISCCDGEDLISESRVEWCGKNKGVQVTAVVGDQDEWRVLGQVFSAFDFEAMPDEQIGANE